MGKKRKNKKKVNKKLVKKNKKLTSKTKKLKSKNKTSFKNKILNLFKKKNKKVKKSNIVNKKTKSKKEEKKSINLKEKIKSFTSLLNKKIDIKKNSKLTKEMYIFIFIITELVLFNLALFASKVIPFEYYNSIEFLALVFFNPFVLIIEGITYGTKFGFSYFVAIVLALVFVLSVFVYLKIEFLFYLPIYFIFVMSSEICGLSMRKVKRI